MKQLTLTAALVGLVGASLLAGGPNSVSGTYAEARTAHVFAGGCVMNSEAGTSGRQAVLAWKVDTGSYNGVALDNLSIVAAVTADRNLGIQEIGGDKPNTRAAVYVDEQATPRQRMALVAMANELSRGIVSTVVEITPAPIRFTDDAHAVRVAAGQVALDVDKHIEHDPSCGDMQWFHPLSSTASSGMGMTKRHAFTGTALGTKWSDPNKRSAFFGTFSR
ncbi:MAG: DUF1326 domain-containing protein [Acidimicrobiia bacterium]|nr:DUF1326 domain-containing protein [Acidimicrobiia bacterium]